MQNAVLRPDLWHAPDQGGLSTRLKAVLLITES